MNISEMSLRRLRRAIQMDEASFPSQAPLFARQIRADIQWRLVVLYFVRNWTCAELGDRYGITPSRSAQIIGAWVARAVALGYLQEIPPAAIYVGPAESDKSGLQPAGRVVVSGESAEVMAYVHGS